MKMQINYSKHEAGFALLEVLVSFVVIAFGLLGIGQLLIVGNKTNSSSYIKQQAIQSAYDIVERIHGNSTAAIAGSYNINNLTTTGAATIPSVPLTNCSTTTCTAAQLATYDCWFWLAQDLAQIPNGSGSIATTVASGTTTLVVTVQWDDSPAQSTLGAANQTQSGHPNLAQFTVTTLL